MFEFTDTDGQRYKIRMRGAYTNSIRSKKALLYGKQKTADRYRAMPNQERVADAIEKMTIMRWLNENGLVTWSERVV